MVLLISGLAIYNTILNEKPLSIAIIATLFSVIVINIFLLIAEKMLAKIIDYLMIKYDKKKMKSYNLFEWMGESNWLTLYDNISKIKQFDKNLIDENYNEIKKEIKKEFNSIKKLESFKIYLEVKVESPKLTILSTVTQTILLALITSALISYMNGINDSEFNGYLYILIVVIVWFILLGAISFITKQIDKFKLLLKLVVECINDEKNSNV